MEATVSAKHVFRALTACALSLAGIHVAIQTAKLGFGHDEVLGLIRPFDLDDEFNFPSLFSFLLFCGAGAILSVLAWRAGIARGKYHLHWAGMAIIFFFLSFDEIFSIHEQWTPFIRGALHTSGFLHYAWQLPYLVFFLLLLKAYVPFFQHLDGRTRSLMALSALIYALAVIFLESIGGWYYSIHGPSKDALYIALSTAEETLEMIGLITFIRALLERMSQQLPRITFTMKP